MARLSDTDESLLSPKRLPDWRMAGRGAFMICAEGMIESRGGPGLLWYTGTRFADFVLDVEWRTRACTDNSGVFIRCPALGARDADHDWESAIAQGYEIQIDDRGYDPERKSGDSPLHSTGAIYKLAPATQRAGRGPGEWNRFRICAAKFVVRVELNGVLVSELARDVGRRREGHIALQAHDEESRVRFRALTARRID